METSIIGSGTVMAMRWLSGSSAWVSLLGHQMLAPTPSDVVAIHGCPRLSVSQLKPPSHGGRLATVGLPVVVDAVTVFGLAHRLLRLEGHEPGVPVLARR